MSKLQEAFGGWVTLLVPGEDFVEGSTTCTGWEEPEDDQSYDYESIDPIPVLQDTAAVYGKGGPMPFQTEQSAWARVSIALKTLAEIVGGSAKSYQHNEYEEGKLQQPVYSFQYFPGDAGLQLGERL